MDNSTNNSNAPDNSTPLFKAFIFNISGINFAHNHAKDNNTQIKLYSWEDIT